MKIKCFLTFIPVLIALSLLACNKEKEISNQSTISVFGTGTVLVKPDMIQMNVTLSHLAQTTKKAQEEVNKTVKQVLKILKEASIEDKNIATASLTFRPEYKYHEGRSLIGQRAEQTINFSVDYTNSDDEKVSKIIDQFIQIDGIELNRMNFSVKNNTEHFAKSRELAFQKAAEKADQYAKLSKLKIAKVLSISEEGHQQILPITNRFTNQAIMEQAAYGDVGSTIIPTGELEVTTRILVMFSLE